MLGRTASKKSGDAGAKFGQHAQTPAGKKAAEKGTPRLLKIRAARSWRTGCPRSVITRKMRVTRSSYLSSGFPARHVFDLF